MSSNRIRYRRAKVLGDASEKRQPLAELRGVGLLSQGWIEARRVHVARALARARTGASSVKAVPEPVHSDLPNACRAGMNRKFDAGGLVTLSRLSPTRQTFWCPTPQKGVRILRNPRSPGAYRKNGNGADG
jgi:hypothetical protein